MSLPALFVVGGVRIKVGVVQTRYLLSPPELKIEKAFRVVHFWVILFDYAWAIASF